MCLTEVLKSQLNFGYGIETVVYIDESCRVYSHHNGALFEIKQIDAKRPNAKTRVLIIPISLKDNDTHTILPIGVR